MKLIVTVVTIAALTAVAKTQHASASNDQAVESIKSVDSGGQDSSSVDQKEAESEVEKALETDDQKAVQKAEALKPPYYYSIIRYVFNKMLSNGTKVEDLVQLINNYPEKDRSVYGLIALHSLMQERNELDQPGTVVLAFALKEKMDELGSKGAPLEPAEKLRDELPESVRNLAFSECILIRRSKKSEDMYSPIDKFKKDKKRRFIFTWIPGEPQNNKQGCWKVIPQKSNTFLIQNKAGKEYVYAAYDKLNFDKKRRSVFSWTPGGFDKQSEWIFEPSGENMYIKSKNFDEYMVADSEKKYDQKRRRVFTWIPKEKTNDALWKIVEGNAEKNGAQ